jgi:hypothetical protein
MLTLVASNVKNLEHFLSISHIPKYQNVGVRQKTASAGED